MPLDDPYPWLPAELRASAPRTSTALNGRTGLERHSAAGRQAVVLLQRAARRRRGHHRVHRTADLPAVPEDGARAGYPAAPARNRPRRVSWQTLLDSDGDDLEVTYRHILERLGRQPGTLGVIFRKAQNRIQDPAKLKRLIVDLIDRENWSATGTDVKGDTYEQLLSKGAEDIKSGAGQYFTPRALTHAMVDCLQPSASDTVVDPAAGTGGFLLAAHEYASKDAETLNPTERDNLRDGFVHGVELVDGTARLAAMNLLLRDFDLHTMLRLPTGIFYAQGVKANVLFFDKLPAAEQPWTQRLWVYDLRTNQHFTLKQNQLRRKDLDDFVACYAPGKPRSERVESERFTSFAYDEVIARDKANLDIT